MERQPPMLLLIVDRWCEVDKGPWRSAFAEATADKVAAAPTPLRRHRLSLPNIA
jgi:hypothetical protein